MHLGKHREEESHFDGESSQDVHKAKRRGRKHRVRAALDGTLAGKRGETSSGYHLKRGKKEERAFREESEHGLDLKKL